MQNDALLKKLSEYQMVMSKFVHEIRNPLTLVNCELQMLTEKHPESEHWDEICDIQEQLIYINKLIHEFSDYSNADRLFLKPVGIHHFLSHMADSFRPIFNYLGIQLITEIPDNLPEIPIDPLRLRQAMTNLLRNAEESITHDHGEITISARIISSKLNADSIPDDYIQSRLLISVTDNGCGISPEHLPQIGTPFVTYKENGTGLGLSVTRQIIEAHNGTMEIISSPSKGTTVQLSLPFSRMV